MLEFDSADLVAPGSSALDIFVDAETEINADISDDFYVEQDYNNLLNRPTFNGSVLEGDVTEKDPTVPAWAKAPVKPQYSAEEVGAIPVSAGLNAADLEYMWDTTEI